MHYDTHSGFTLVEVLVVLGLMALLVYGVVGGISNFASRQAFDGAVVDVRDVVVTARERTLASTNDSLYGVHVSTTAVTRFPGAVFTVGDPNNFIFALPKGITATPSFSNAGPTATFTRLTGLPSATGTILLEDAINNLSATITLSASGRIQ